MSSPVRFHYHCGCTEDVQFGCAAPAAACPPRRGQRHDNSDSEDTGAPMMSTWLDERCHDCSKFLALLLESLAHTGSSNSSGMDDDDDVKEDDSDSESEGRVLRERDVNLPSKLPPPPTTTTLSSEP